MWKRSISQLCLAITLVCMATGAAQMAQAQGSDTVPRILAAVNSDRVANGLAPYALNSLLTLSAQRHSEYQAGIGQWTHTGADGSLSLQRALAVGYPASRTNENVYAGTSSPEEVVHWWYTADAAHRNNVLHTAMREIGIGAALGADGTTYFTMDISAQPNVLPLFIDSDAYSTSNPNVTLTLTNEFIFPGGPGQIGSVSQVLVSNSPDFAGASPQGWAEYIQWTLDTSSGAGPKTVYVRYIDPAGRTADSQDSIVLAEGGPFPPAAPQPTSPPPPPEPTALPVLVTPQPARPGPTPVPGQAAAPRLPTAAPSAIPTATASPQSQAAQREAAPTLDFSDSLYMKAQRGEALGSPPGGPDQNPPSGAAGALRQVMVVTLALGMGAAVLGYLRLARFWRSQKLTKETSADGDG
jgi:hypothetical protein